MYNKTIKNPSEMNEVTYKRIQNKFNKMKKSAEKKYYCDRLEKAKGNLKLSSQTH